MNETPVNSFKNGHVAAGCRTAFTIFRLTESR